MRFSYFLGLIALILISIASGCSCAHNNASSVDGDTLTHNSQVLSIIDVGDYIRADIRNPWGKGLLASYLIVDKDFSGSLPEGTVVRVPLSNSIVYSGVHTGIIDELGALDRVKGVADGRYFSSPTIQQMIRSGLITDVGNASSPSIEKIVDIDPDAILLSPYQNQELGAVSKLGVPVIQMADYMESTPLGRAEWIKLIGLLYGRRAKADSIYEAVVSNYRQLTEAAAQTSERPVVITEMPQPGGVWDIPSGESYMARMLQDAAVSYPWATTPGAGSLKMDAAAMLENGGEADYWLIRTFGPLTRQMLNDSSPLVKYFRPFKNSKVFFSDTSRSGLYDEFPFHPERLLQEYIKIFHPGAAGAEDNSLRYFQRLSDK